MKYLGLLALVSLCLWLNIPALKAETAVIGASKAYFASPATTNGERRFIAIGNFFDTTNAAYYFGSQGLLEFELPADANYLLTSANLQLYKYANAYPGEVRIGLYQADKLLGTAAATARDNDYQLLEFNLTEIVKQSWGQRLRLSLRVDSAKYQEGVAVCSGKLLDSICPEKYAPSLSLSYRYNTLGSVEQHQYYGETVANLTTHSPYVSCQYQSGCEVKHQVKLQDDEGNLSFKLVYQSAGGEEFSKTISFSPGPVTLSMKLKDGNYESWYELHDAGYQVKTKLGSLGVNTSILPANSWQSIKIAYSRLSPLNSDGIYDTLKAEVQLGRQIKQLKARLVSPHNTFYDLAVNWRQQQDRIYIEAISIPELEGNYRFDVYGTDVNDYEISTIDRPSLVFDNHPPQLF